MVWPISKYKKFYTNKVNKYIEERNGELAKDFEESGGNISTLYEPFKESFKDAREYVNKEGAIFPRRVRIPLKIGKFLVVDTAGDVLKYGIGALVLTLGFAGYKGAENLDSFDKSIINFYKGLKQEERLTPEQREKLLEEALSTSIVDKLRSRGNKNLTSLENKANSLAESNLVESESEEPAEEARTTKRTTYKPRPTPSKPEPEKPSKPTPKKRLGKCNDFSSCQKENFMTASTKDQEERETDLEMGNKEIRRRGIISTKQE